MESVKRVICELSTAERSISNPFEEEEHELEEDACELAENGCIPKEEVCAFEGDAFEEEGSAFEEDGYESKEDGCAVDESPLMLFSLLSCCSNSHACLFAKMNALSMASRSPARPNSEMEKEASVLHMSSML